MFLSLNERSSSMEDARWFGGFIMNCEKRLNMYEEVGPGAGGIQAFLVGVKLITSFPSKVQASFGVALGRGVAGGWLLVGGGGGGERK